MPMSSRHKSHKQSKHSSKDYWDSEEDVLVKEKISKENDPVGVNRDSVSGEKRKISSQVQEAIDGKDLGGYGNGETSGDYVSSKRRKERADGSVAGNRWNGGTEDRGDTDRSVVKEINKEESSKLQSKLKDSGNKGETLRTESKNKSKRYESGSVWERKEDGFARVLVDKEESMSKGDSKWKSEKDSSTRKEGRESKDKDRRLEKEKNGVQEHKRAEAGVKFVEMDVGKKQGSQLGDFIEEKQSKRVRENSERCAHDESRNPELEKEKDAEKKMRRRREGSSERDKHRDDSRECDERRMSSRSELSKDMKYRYDKLKDGSYINKYQDESHGDERATDEKYREEADNDSKYRDDKHREDGEKDSRLRDDRHRKDGSGDKYKDDKYREDGERDSKHKDEKYREGTEREGRRRDDRNYEKHRGDNDKYIRRSDDKYQEEAERDDRHKHSSYRKDGDRDSRHKEEKYQDTERDIRYKNSKKGDDFDREKRQRDTKYGDERTATNQSGDKSDPKQPGDDGYVTARSRKSSAHDDSPNRDDRTTRYWEEQGRRRLNEKEDYDDARSRGTTDQSLDIEKRTANSARLESMSEKGRSSSRNADTELTPGHKRRRSSPTGSYHVSRDQYRSLKQDDSTFRDDNYEDRVHNRDCDGGIEGSGKILSSRSLEKFSQKDDSHSGDLSAERRLKSDIRASPLHLVNKSPLKSPLSSSDKRQFSRFDVRRSIDVEESTQRTGSSRDVNEYSGNEGRGSRQRNEGRGNWELPMDVPLGEDSTPLDEEPSSVSSPPMKKNNHFNGPNKALLPPPSFRSGLDSPSLLVSAEEGSRSRVNSRQRRVGDPNIGRMQGHAWRGIPSWPSPVANGFLSFPHAPPPIGFPSVMQQFPTPPIFGVRPPIEFSHTTSYPIPDADRFAGPGHPMGWHNQMDTWEGNTAFGDSHMYGRPEWEHSRNISGGRGWNPSGDLWEGSSRSVNLDPDKEDNPMQNMDETLEGLSAQPAQSDQTRADQQAQSSEISQSNKSYDKNDVEPHITSVETSDAAKVSIRDDLSLCDVYLSKLDISADLAEPEIFNQCTGFIGLDQSILLDVDDVKVLYMEEAVEAEVAVPQKILSYKLLSSTDHSVFQKAMFLYKKLKVNSIAEDGNKPDLLGDIIPNSDQEDRRVEDDQTASPSEMNEAQGIEDSTIGIVAGSHSSLQKVEGCEESSLEKFDVPVASSATEESKELEDHVDMETSPAFDSGLLELEIGNEEKPSSVENVENKEALLLAEVKILHAESGGAGESLKLLDTKCGPLLNSDVSYETEAMMPETMVSGSVNLSRIHHSPESTH